MNDEQTIASPNSLAKAETEKPPEGQGKRKRVASGSPHFIWEDIREISAIVLCVGRNKYFTVMSPVELEEEKRQTWTWVGDPFCLFFLICRLSFISNTEWPKTRGLRSTNVPCVLPIPFLLACPESPKDSCLGLSSLAGVGRWKECQKQPDQVPCGCPAQWAHSAAPGAGLWDANLWHIRYPGSPQGAH